MELYFNIANVAKIERLARIFLITGVTTSPSIVVVSKEPIWDVSPRLQNAIDEKDILFAQTIGREAQGTVGETKRLSNAVPGLVMKVPVTSGGLAAIKILKKEGIATLRTAVYSTSQGLLATLVEAEYITPYVSRIDAQDGNGVRTIQELQTLLELHTPNSMVLATSFKTPRRALSCSLAEREAITLPLNVAQQTLNTPAIESAIEKFEQDWNNAFGHINL